jgi:hypothetical protein
VKSKDYSIVEDDVSDSWNHTSSNDHLETCIKNGYLPKKFKKDLMNSSKFFRSPETARKAFESHFKLVNHPTKVGEKAYILVEEKEN